MIDECEHACSVTSVVSDSAAPWTEARQVPLSMKFSRQEYWSGLPCPPPWDLPDPHRATCEATQIRGNHMYFHFVIYSSVLLKDS